MVLATMKKLAIALILVSMVALVAFFLTNNHRLLTGGSVGVLVGGAILTTANQLRKERRIY